MNMFLVDRSPKDQIHSYITGLPRTMQEFVLEHSPETLERAIELAVLKDKVYAQTHDTRPRPDHGGVRDMEINQTERFRKPLRCYACQKPHRLRDCKDPCTDAKRKEIDEYRKKRSGKEKDH